jgi:hypothetical protein
MSVLTCEYVDCDGYEDKQKPGTVNRPGFSYSADFFG